MTLMRALLPALLLSFAAPAFAVYKCEANGRTSYSDTPCQNGKALDLAVPPATADAAGARRQLAQEKSEAKRLENERHRREAKEDREQRRVAQAQASAKKKCDALARRVKWAGEDAAAASARSTAKARGRAHRLAEQYDADCA